MPGPFDVWPGRYNRPYRAGTTHGWGGISVRRNRAIHSAGHEGTTFSDHPHDCASTPTSHRGSTPRSLNVASLIDPSRLASRRPSGVTASGTWPNCGRCPAQGPVEQDLPGGAGDQIVAADHLVHSHQGVVDHDRELVGRAHAVASDEEVAAQTRRVRPRRTKDRSSQTTGPAGTRNRQANGRSPSAAASRRRPTGTGPGIGRPFVLGVRGARGPLDLGPRAGAGVDQLAPPSAGPGPRRRPPTRSLWRKGPASQSRPSQRRSAMCRFRRLGANPGGVQVLDPEDDLAPACRAASQAIRNVRAWPRCRPPVGEGARRPTTGFEDSAFVWLRFSRNRV